MFCKGFIEKPFSVMKYNFMAFPWCLDNAWKMLIPIKTRKKPDGKTVMDQNAQRPE